VTELATAGICEKSAEIHPYGIHVPSNRHGDRAGSINVSEYQQYFEDLVPGINDVCGDHREGSFIFQPLSVTCQRLNVAVLSSDVHLHDDSHL